MNREIRSYSIVGGEVYPVVEFFQAIADFSQTHLIIHLICCNICLLPQQVPAVDQLFESLKKSEQRWSQTDMNTDRKHGIRTLLDRQAPPGSFPRCWFESDWGWSSQLEPEPTVRLSWCCSSWQTVWQRSVWMSKKKQNWLCPKRQNVGLTLSDCSLVRIMPCSGIWLLRLQADWKTDQWRPESDSSSAHWPDDKRHHNSLRYCRITTQSYARLNGKITLGNPQPLPSYFRNYFHFNSCRKYLCEGLFSGIFVIGCLDLDVFVHTIEGPGSVGCGSASGLQPASPSPCQPSLSSPDGAPAGCCSPPACWKCGPPNIPVTSGTSVQINWWYNRLVN